MTLRTHFQTMRKEFYCTFQICINPSTTSRIAFKHHIVKQINYCYLMLSDIVHVMLYTAQ